MAIPTNPTATTGALPYASPIVANNLAGLCTKSANGFKFAPMQFLFTQTASWLVDMSAGAPNPPLDQVAALYVDATQSTHDVLISFPDSGYQVRVTQGSNSLVPAITGNTYPKFYVTLLSNSNNIQQGPVNTTDIVNVTAMNQFIPEFNTGIFTRQVDYGLGSYFEPTPIFTPDQCFSGIAEYVNATGVNDMIIIPNTEWYINIIDLSMVGFASEAAAAEISLFDGGNLVYSKYTTVNTMNSPMNVGTLQGLNYSSNSTSGLKLEVNFFAVTFNGTLAYNIYGGILAT